jgi:hypothetical protein
MSAERRTNSSSDFTFPAVSLDMVFWVVDEMGTSVRDGNHDFKIYIAKRIFAVELIRDAFENGRHESLSRWRRMPRK